MNFAAFYLANRFFYRLTDFFHHWYVDASWVIAHSFISTLESLDRTFAVKITLQHFFQPLYGDYSVIGRIFGIFFRTSRSIIGLGVYFLCGVLFAVAYVAWISVPLLILAYVLLNI